VTSGVAFQHRQSAHCESGVMSSMVTHAGLPLSEPMAFGLSSALAFALIRSSRSRAAPHRLPDASRAIIRGFAAAWDCRFGASRSEIPPRGWRRSIAR
jgi:hypothetical protein